MNLSKRGTFIESAERAQFKPNIFIQLIILVGLVIGFQIITGVGVGLIALATGWSLNSDSNWNQVILLVLTGVTTLGFVGYCKYIEKRSLYSMGLVRKGILKQYIIGFILGVVLFSIVVTIGLITGSLKYEGCLLGETLGWGLIFLVGWLFQGMEEEVIMRGYLMPSLSNKVPLVAAVLINSIIFAALHLFNSGISILAVTNIALYGIFASLYIIRTNNIWGACAFHSAWNFTQGNVYGISVSGNNVMPSFLKISQANSEILNGGAFGLEGGLITTMVLGIAIGLLFVPGIVGLLNKPCNESTLS